MFFVVVLVACSPSQPHALHSPGVGSRTITVATSGGDFPDLQAALAASTSGDTIEVAPGKYYGAIDFDGKAVRIVGTGGPSQTTLYGTPGKAAIVAKSGEGPGTTLEGFTVTGGGGTTEPAVEDSFSVLNLVNVTLTANSGFATIYARSAILGLDRVAILADNVATEGLVVQGRRGMIAVKDSSIACGDNAVGYIMEHGAAFLDGVTFDCPDAQAAQFFHSNGRAHRSIFDGRFVVENESARDEATYVEGALFFGGVTVTLAHLGVENAVFAHAGVEVAEGKFDVGNSIFTGASCALTALDADSDIAAEYSDFYANSADFCGTDDQLGASGNFSADPAFVDVDTRDYHLTTGSPAINTANPDSDFDDVDGSSGDLGAYGGPFTLDGGW